MSTFIGSLTGKVNRDAHFGKDTDVSLGNSLYVYIDKV